MEKEKSKSSIILAIIIIILLVAILITMIFTASVNGPNIFSKILNNESSKIDENKDSNGIEKEVSYSKSKGLFEKYVENKDMPFMIGDTKGFSELTDTYKLWTSILAIQEDSTKYDNGNLEGYPADKVLNKVKELYPNSSIDKNKEENDYAGAYSYSKEYDAYILKVMGFGGSSLNNILDKVIETDEKYYITFYRIEGDYEYSENYDAEELVYDILEIKTKDYYKLIAQDNYDRKKLESSVFEYKIDAEVTSQDLDNIIKEHKDKLPKIRYTVTKDGDKEYLTKIELLD